MIFKQIKPSTVALLLGGLFLLLVGMYTENGGFQFAGFLLLLVSAILALNEVSNNRKGTD